MTAVLSVEDYSGVLAALQEVAGEEPESKSEHQNFDLPSPNISPSPVAVPAEGHSDAWWWGVSTCESGNGRGSPNLYGIMDFTAGGLSPEDQLAWARRIWDGYGDAAWAAACVAMAYQNAPSG